MINLGNFQKPQRYIGNELGVIKKNHFGKISFCLCYPNLYEIGMDNLGLRIIYGLLNSYSEVVCERCFLPGPDLLRFLLEKKERLFSLETKTALSEFDLIGFNFGYELNYLNFLQMLKAGGVAQESHRRKDIIVIGGGIANPEPLADFVDVFCLGEFETVSDKLVMILRKYKGKQKRLEKIAQVEGFYVPKFYNLNFVDKKYTLEKNYPKAQLPLRRTKVKDLNESYFPLNWLTPHTKLTQDRVPIEIARGCPNNCNFCQARNIYFPHRQKNIETVVSQLKSIYKNSGYESFSLLSLSASDYSQIEKLLEAILPFIQENRISLSLPSLRIGAKLISIYKRLLSFQKTSLTVAMEAATPQLRKRLNKNINPAKLFDSLEILRKLGLKLIKIYFMYGFRQEKTEDLLAIGDFIRNLQKQSFLEINVSINLFIPKPFSPWEGVRLEKLKEAQEKRKIILKNIPRNQKIKVSCLAPQICLIEAILSRADRNLSKVLLSLDKNYQQLQKENTLFSWPVWKETLEAQQIKWSRYLNAKTPNFPWSFIKD